MTVTNEEEKQPRKPHFRGKKSNLNRVFNILSEIIFKTLKQLYFCFCSKINTDGGYTEQSFLLSPIRDQC